MRVKGGTVRRRRHKKVLKANKGYRMTKSKLYKVGHEAYLHAGQYAYAHRQRRKSQIRTIWIDRISAAAKNNGTQYSRLMKSLKDANVQLNKKMLSDIAYNDPVAFSKLVQSL